MASLYEINELLMNCFYMPETDEVVNAETGELFDSSYLDNLQIEKEEKEIHTELKFALSTLTRIL